MSLFARRSSSSIAIEPDALDAVFGGFIWEDLPSSPNVLDMSGAPPLRGLPPNANRVLYDDYMRFLQSNIPGPYQPMTPAARAIGDRIDAYHRTHGQPVDPPPPETMPPDPGPTEAPPPYGTPGSLEDQLGYNDIPLLGQRAYEPAEEAPAEAPEYTPTEVPEYAPTEAPEYTHAETQGEYE